MHTHTDTHKHTQTHTHTDTQTHTDVPHRIIDFKKPGTHWPKVGTHLVLESLIKSVCMDIIVSV